MFACSAASLLSSLSSTGNAGLNTFVIPISPYCFKLLYSPTALACETNTLCIALKYFFSSFSIAGGCAPNIYPNLQNTTVSLNVIQCFTLSPKALKLLMLVVNPNDIMLQMVLFHILNIH